MGPVSSVTASVLLVTGYPLALGVLARLRPVLAERRVWWFAALEAATASITAGWFLHGRPLPAAVNSAAFVGFAIAWLITGQRADPPANKGPTVAIDPADPKPRLRRMAPGNPRSAGKGEPLDGGGRLP